MKFKAYSESQLREAVKQSFSYRQVLLQLNIIPAGGNYSTLKKSILFFNLDISHFTGQRWNKGCSFSPKRDIQDYLTNKQPIQSNKLKKRLIKENYFNEICSSCLLEVWLGQPIPLELDHINGNHDDNQLINLRLLCPNCHAQTDNYRGKNIARTQA